MKINHKQLNSGGDFKHTMSNLFQVVASSADSFNDIEGDVNSFSIRIIGIASVVLLVLLVTASQVNKKKSNKKAKKPLFIAIAATIILPTLLLMGSTVYINTISDSKGPVHWHTDIEFWACGQEVELRNPFEFLSNKIGTATYHEHDDKRIHLEGVVIEKEEDASLRKFMTVTGGSITEESIVIPTDDEFIENDVDGDKPYGTKGNLNQYLQKDEDGRAVLSMKNDDLCEPYAMQKGQLQAFLLRSNKGEDTYTQTKLESPGDYIMRDESTVPPGDCLIVEFDLPKERTTRLCQQYGVRDSKRCTEFGVSAYNPELCKLREVTLSGGAL